MPDTRPALEALMSPMETGRRVHFSIPSIIALIAAILSFTTGAFWGVILAVVAIFFGLIGLLMSFAPSERGGFVSVFSIVVAVIGIVVAGFKAIAALF